MGVMYVRSLHVEHLTLRAVLLTVATPGSR